MVDSTTQIDVRTAPVEVLSDGCGRRRLFATGSIAAGEIILHLDGVLRATPSRHSIQVGEGEHLDEFGAAEATNHSCEPTAFVDLSDNPRVCLRAISDLNSGSEVTIDYCATEGELSVPFSCDCGSKRCYGLVRGYRFLEPSQPIRSAALEDASHLAELSELLGYPVPEDVVARRLERLIGRAEETVLVAESASGQVVGWVHGSEQELLEAGRRCEILGLVVHSEHRDVGLGRQLVEAVEEWATSRGLKQISVQSNVLRAEAHPFYERLGYARAKTQHAYRKQLSERGTV